METEKVGNEFLLQKCLDVLRDSADLPLVPGCGARPTLGLWRWPTVAWRDYETTCQQYSTLNLAKLVSESSRFNLSYLDFWGQIEVKRQSSTTVCRLGRIRLVDTSCFPSWHAMWCELVCQPEVVRYRVVWWEDRESISTQACVTLKFALHWFKHGNDTA